MNVKILFITVVGFIILFTLVCSKSTKDKIILCPDGLADTLSKPLAFHSKRQLLFETKILVVIFQIKENKIIPVTHYRHRHSTSGLMKEKVSFEEPLMVGAPIIIDKKTSIGIAVKELKEGAEWKYIWEKDITFKEFSDHRVIYLPPLSSMKKLNEVEQ